MADTKAAEQALLEAIEALAKVAQEGEGYGATEAAGKAVRDLAEALERVHGVRDRKPGRVGHIG